MGWCWFFFLGGEFNPYPKVVHPERVWTRQEVVGLGQMCFRKMTVLRTGGHFCSSAHWPLKSDIRPTDTLESLLGEFQALVSLSLSSALLNPTVTLLRILHTAPE